MLSVLIPANNEEGYIGPCLDALLAQQGPGLDGMEAIVAANACTDTTVALARGYADRFAARGWRIEVLDIAEGGKPNALDHADAAATPMGPGLEQAQARLAKEARRFYETTVNKLKDEHLAELQRERRSHAEEVRPHTHTHTFVVLRSHTVRLSGRASHRTNE